MKIIAEYEVKLPDYSLCYLVNGDSSGLEPDDKIKIDKYMDKFYNQYPNNHVDISWDDNEAESYFSNSPAFGLPCNVFDCKIVVLGN